MSEPRTPASATWPRWMKLAVGATALCFLAAGMFMLPTANPGHGRKGTALATAIAIESSVNNIYTEYGKIPNVGNRVTTNSPEGLKLLHILLGLDDKSDDALNSQAIKFLVVREGKNKKNGLIYAADGKSVEGLYDPWGNPYTVTLDTKYVEELHFAIAGKSVDLKGRRVAVFSPGQDMKLGTADDVKTW